MLDISAQKSSQSWFSPCSRFKHGRAAYSPTDHADIYKITSSSTRVTSGPISGWILKQVQFWITYWLCTMEHIVIVEKCSWATMLPVGLRPFGLLLESRLCFSHFVTSSKVKTHIPSRTLFYFNFKKCIKRYKFKFQIQSILLWSVMQYFITWELAFNLSFTFLTQDGFHVGKAPGCLSA